MVTLSDHLPVRAVFTLSYPPPKVCISWTVRFEKIPCWHNEVPFTCQFVYLDDYWNINGSYRDWVGIYLASMANSLQPFSWLYVISCYTSMIANKTVIVAEFPCLSAGNYRVGYYSANRSCLIGLSDVFTIGSAT